ncbi:G-protein coupled receptor 37-like 1 [Gadus chalcogrammus]|uniref:G-protein coupled receptor 37-like 1 n=1 Tax=Gadus chalcogrammus TaxID=1042646 RepID=UPI0024C284D8|nr:G-protein coupled receptor 37-like 1 [Gadus chalcogrammus]
MKRGPSSHTLRSQSPELQYSQSLQPDGALTHTARRTGEPENLSSTGARRTPSLVLCADGPRHKTYRQISPCASRTAPESLHHPNHPDSLHRLDRLHHALDVRQTGGSRRERPPTQLEEFSVPKENLLPQAVPRGAQRLLEPAELRLLGPLPVEPLLLEPAELRLLEPRLARSAGEEEESTFGQSFESDWVTTPQDTDITSAPEQAGEDSGHHGNSSIPPDHHGNSSGPPGPLRPSSPLEEGSAAGYAMLGLGALVLALGVLGNMAVMCVVWNNYYMRSAWNYLLASMAFWDFLVLVFCLPVVVLNQLSHRRILSDITCRMVPYMEMTSLGITSFSLCALGIDRFHAATSGSRPRPRRVERCGTVLLKLLLVWGCSLLLSSPELFLWEPSSSSSSSHTLVDSCSLTPSSPLSLLLPDSLHSLLLRYHQGRMWWCFGCYFCLPVLFTLLCQLATCNVSSDSSSAQKQRSHDDQSAHQSREQHAAAERKLSCTVLALAVVYAVCVLPEHVCNITLAYTQISLSQDTLALMALLHHFLLFFKSSVTPVLLLCLCKALGQAFMDCCCCCCQECQPINSQGSPGSAHIKLKTANEVASSAIFFEKAKDSSAILSISS